MPTLCEGGTDKDAANKGVIYMAVFTWTQVINKPVEQVFNIAIDVANFPKWNPTTKSARQLTEGKSATIERLPCGHSSGLQLGFLTTIGNTKAAITFSGLFAPSLPIGTGCHAKIALERLTKSDLRIVADRQSDFNQCRWVCSQQSSSFREAHTGEILHGRLANQLLEFGG